MNITPLDIYLVSLCGKISDLVGIAMMSGVVAIIASGIVVGINNTEYGNKHLASIFAKCMKRSAVFVCFATAIYAITPSSKALAAMYVIPAIANSGLVSKDIPEAGKALIEMATEWMRTQTKSIKEKTK